MSTGKAPSRAATPAAASTATPAVAPAVTLRRRGPDAWALASRDGPLIVDARTADAARHLQQGITPDELPATLPWLTPADAEELARIVDDGAEHARDLELTDPAHPALLRAVAPIALAGLVLSASALLVAGTVPAGGAFAPPGVPPLLAAAVAVLVAVVTTALHESAHVLTGRPRGGPLPRVRLRWWRAVTTADLTHTWGWAKPHQLAALGAGVAVDLAVLAAFAGWTALGGGWFPRLVVAVLVARLIWQGGTHRRTDVYFAVAAVLDSPSPRQAGSPRVRRLFAALAALGVCLDLVLLYGWLWRWIAAVTGL